MKRLMAMALFALTTAFLPAVAAVSMGLASRTNVMQEMRRSVVQAGFRVSSASAAAPADEAEGREGRREKPTRRSEYNDSAVSTTKWWPSFVIISLKTKITACFDN